jgi:hypothetical protein
LIVAPLAGGALAAVVGCLLFKDEEGTEQAPKIAEVNEKSKK